MITVVELSPFRKKLITLRCGLIKKLKRDHLHKQLPFLISSSNVGVGIRAGEIHYWNERLKKN